MSRDLDRFVDREIVGVIPDIHFSSLHDEMKATVYAEPNPNYSRNISVKLAPGDYDAAIEHIEAVWRRLVPNQPPNWQFLEDRFDARYKDEARQAKMFAVFSAFAIFVATLGLFGLASFTTERRTKEIGIRKVMGASVSDVVLFASSVEREQGNRFVYRAPFGDWAWLFLAAAGIALAAAWITIAAQAGRAATSRPVLALRYE